MQAPSPLTIASAIGAAGTCRICRRNADPVADFYKGKTINMIVGGSVGGGYDVLGRTIGAVHRPAHSGQSVGGGAGTCPAPAACWR